MACKYFILSLTILLPLLAMGQQRECELTGDVYINSGATCKYTVICSISNNEVTGYSITKQPDGRDLQAMITGKLDRKQHTLDFTEYKMPLMMIAEDCLFDVKLSYKTVGEHYFFIGSFTGKNSQGEFCDKGTVFLETPRDNKLFETVKPKKRIKAMHQQAMPHPVEKGPLIFNKLTATVHQEFDWRTDTCIMEIWDGEVVDGDTVTVDFNGLKVLQHYMLVAARKRLILPIHKKTNTITVFAENEGLAPPNTSMILLKDGETGHGVLATIRKGETAVIVIHKN